MFKLLIYQSQRVNPNATKKTRDETLRARRGARRHDKDRTTLKSILSCEVLFLLFVKRGAINHAVSIVNLALIIRRNNEHRDKQRAALPRTS